MPIWQWAKTPAANAAADPTINFAEGQAGSTLNDSCRNMMAALASYRDDTSGLLPAVNSGVTYQVTSNEGLPATPPDGQFLMFTPNVNSVNGHLLQVDGGTAFPLQTIPGAGIAAGTLSAGAVYGATFRLAIPAWILSNFFVSSVGPGSITTGLIADAAVTYAKIQSVTNGRLLGNFTGTPAAPSEYGLGSFLAVTGTTLNLASDPNNKGKVIGYDSATGAPTAVASGPGALFHVREEQANGVNGQSPTGAWARRVLNATKTNEVAGASLAGNQLTLPAGIYFAEGMCIGNGQGFNNTWTMKARLRDVTNSVTLTLGSNDLAQVIPTGADASNNSVTVKSFMRGKFTLVSATTVEFQAWSTGAPNGGNALGSGEVEIYTDLVLWKVG